MLFKNAKGREIEASFSGMLDDIECDYAVYTDTGDDATDEDVDYIYDTYSERLEESVLERMIMQAEDHYEGER